MTFSQEELDKISRHSHHSFKQNRIRTQNEIVFDLWGGIRGSVLTLPGQATPKICHLYYGITDGFYHPLHMYELDEGTVDVMNENLDDYSDYCRHYINFKNVIIVNDCISKAQPAAVEDLDFCCAPHTVGQTILNRLRKQASLFAGPKGFSYTVTEVHTVPGSQIDALILMNNVIRALDGAVLIEPFNVELTGLHAQQHVTYTRYNRSERPYSFCYKYDPPLSQQHKGRIEDMRWFRFRDKHGSISNTFAVRYN